MTLRKAISLTKVSRATAWRDLADLVNQEALAPVGEGRSRAYRIQWPHAGDDHKGDLQEHPRLAPEATEVAKS
jgi:DeoR/GlpR family transcriptional regulator of sugar metabolism